MCKFWTLWGGTETIKARIRWSRAQKSSLFHQSGHMAVEDHGDSIMGVCFSQHARSLATVLLGWKDPGMFFFRRVGDLGNSLLLPSLLCFRCFW